MKVKDHIPGPKPIKVKIILSQKEAANLCRILGSLSVADLAPLVQDSYGPAGSSGKLNEWNHEDLHSAFHKAYDTLSKYLTEKGIDL